jgi:two-component system, OmpR family, response regulator RegX3
MRIAVLEDDVSQMELISRWLQMAGHHVHAFERGADLLRALEQETFDALLLDWNVPDMNGIEVLKRVRQQLSSRIPVLFSTARSEEVDVVLALRQGADGYLVKPLRRLELLARVEAVTRRNVAEGSLAQHLEVGVFRVDTAARRLLRNNETLELTAKDFDLAVFFLRNVGRLLSRGHLRESVWNAKAAVSSRTLDTHVSRVRNKLRLVPEHGWRLMAVYGYGYRLEQLSEASALRSRMANSPTKEQGQPVLEDALDEHL